MNHQEISEVRRTWSLVSSRMPLFAQLLRARLQAVGISQPGLSAGEIEANAQLLLRLIGISVNGLNQPRILYPLLETLGRENALGMFDAQRKCQIVRALLWALKAILGPAFDRKARHAWLDGYRRVAQAIAAGATEAREAFCSAAEPEMPVLAGKRAISFLQCSKNATAAVSRFGSQVVLA